MNIDEMQAGREMDALIAEKIFGLKVEWEIEYLGEQIPSSKQLADKYDENGILPLYSTDIAAAWEVVEGVREKFNLLMNVHPYSLVAANGGYRVSVNDLHIELDYTTADTAPLAICRAALKALSPALPASQPLSHDFSR